jgi:uncharacterized membrane protein
VFLTLCLLFRYETFEKKWRPWCEAFRDQVEDYNMATLIRVNSSDEYGEENTCIGNYY